MTVPQTGKDVAEACPYAVGAQGKRESAGSVSADAHMYECVCVHTWVESFPEEMALK